MKFEQKITLFAKKNGLEMTWRTLKYGYKQAVFPCNDWETYGAIQALCSKVKGWKVDTWVCYDGIFEGYVRVMDADAAKEFEDRQNEELQKIEDWWRRYHVADAETRRLMGCGAIS